MCRLPSKETEHKRWLAAILGDNTPDSKDTFCTKDKSSGHNCSKFSFTLNVDLCEVIDKLPKIKADLSSDIKMGLVYVSGYVSCYDDDFDDTHFLYLKYGSFLIT